MIKLLNNLEKKKKKKWQGANYSLQLVTTSGKSALQIPLQLGRKPKIN